MTRQRNFALMRIAVVVIVFVFTFVLLCGILSQNLDLDLPLRWTPNGFTVIFGSDYYSNTISWRYNNDDDNDNNICSVEDIVYGEWLDDKPLESLEEVTERYQLAVSRKHRGSEGTPIPSFSALRLE